MGLEDLAMFRAIPNATVLYPSDAVSTEHLVEAAARLNGICYLRTSRPKTPILYPNTEQFPIPGFKVLRQSASDRATILAAGVTLHEALAAAETLKTQGVNVRVIDLYCVKPLDGAALGEHVRASGGRLVVVEDHYPEGGLAEAALAALAAAGVALSAVRHLAVTRVPHSGKPEELLDKFGISARHIVEAVQSLPAG
jgi:transketolase